MPRHKRDSKLETKGARLRLATRPKPYFTALEPRLALGYRKNKRAAGVWIVRGSFAKGHKQWTRAFATSDDFTDKDGETILDFWQAQDRARKMLREHVGGHPVTVAEAIEGYAADLKMRGQNRANADRLKPLLPPELLATPVALVTERALSQWRHTLIEVRGNKPAGADRSARMLSAALNLAARQDAGRITNGAAWRNGLRRLPPTEAPPKRTVDLATVRRIVRAAHKHDPEFGNLVEVLAATGARWSQVARLVVADLQDNGGKPRLLMPPSFKGRGRRAVAKLPITRKLATKLKRAAAGRQPTDPLISAGSASSDPHAFIRAFAKIVAGLGLDPEKNTAYVLRHTHIIHQLKRRPIPVPIRIVAAAHNTSVGEIERVYSHYITDDSDEILRGALVDFD